MNRSFLRALTASIAAIAVGIALAGCSIVVPADPRGTLDRITEGELRVGAAPSEGLVTSTEVGTGAAVSGPLSALIEDFATHRGATVTWTVDTEERLVEELEAGVLDLVIGGMTDATPWSDRASVTRGYPELPGANGRSIALLLPLGENALQSALEEFLDGEVK